MIHFAEGKPNRWRLAGALQLIFGGVFGRMSIKTSLGAVAQTRLSSIRERGLLRVP